MFLPFETSLSMWYAAMPQYEWVPGPPQGPEYGAVEEAAGAEPPARVPLAVVFRGVLWSAYPVWHAQPNPAWEIVAENRRDAADETAQEHARHARRPMPPDASRPSVGGSSV